MGIFGGILGGAADLLGGIWRNTSAKREAERNRNFQERLSSTSHQREVEDLRAAGLNPILSAGGGSGSSTPSGSMAQVENAVTPALNSANQARLIQAQIDQIKSQTSLNDANSRVSDATVGKVIADTELSGSHSAQSQQLTQNLSVERDRIIADTQYLRERIKNAPTERERNRASAELDRRMSELRTVDTAIRRYEVPAASSAAAFHSSAVGQRAPYVEHANPLKNPLGAGNLGLDVLSDVWRNLKEDATRKRLDFERRRGK